MTPNDWLQLALYLAVLLALVKPLGAWMALAFAEQPNALTRLGGPLERALYRLGGVRADAEMDWRRYTVALLTFNLAGLVLLYLLQRVQGVLPLNPAHLPGVGAATAFDTAVSFATNTNWQSYAGETTMSYLTDLLGLTVQNFLSAATGIAVLLAVIRGFRRRSAATIGNVWVDLTRATLYVLLPLSLLLALVLTSQGVIQNLHANLHVPLLQAPVATSAPATQVLPMGPVASQEAIKQLGTNGGGFFNANSAHPFENPTPLSNFLELVLIFAIGSGLTYTLGQMTGSPRHGWAVWCAMAILFLVGVTAAYSAEARGNPLIQNSVP